MKAHVKELIREAWEKSISRDNKWRYDYIEGACVILYKLNQITWDENIGIVSVFDLISDYFTHGKDYDAEEIEVYLKNTGLTLEYLFSRIYFKPYK